ncbi:hypothetical protein [Helicobacter sp. 23-1045]
MLTQISFNIFVIVRFGNAESKQSKKNCYIKRVKRAKYLKFSPSLSEGD